MKKTLKSTVYEYLNPSPDDPTSEKIVNVGMLLLIILNVLAVVLETIKPLYEQRKLLFDSFETFSVIVFTIEYFLRLWSCTSQIEYRNTVTGRVKYALQFMQLVDLLAILPFYIPLLGIDLRFIRTIRLFRLFRLFKIGRYSQALTTILRVIKSKKEELGITLFTGFILLILASSLMYIIESPYQPDRFSSIPASMWWGAVTLTTVGYGDIYPVTTLGKILGIIISMFGIGLFALPAGIVASGFTSELHHQKRVCPHCGQEIDE